MSKPLKRKTTKKEREAKAREALARTAASLFEHATAIYHATPAELLKRATFVENCAHHIRWAAEDLTDKPTKKGTDIRHD